ncbi:MAG TPA: family 78 glycoside hydrolase catalytic domain, partial [Anaerolineae bacterium]
MTQVSPMYVTDPRCEFMLNPLGIDEREPHFSWALQDERRGQQSTGYRVLVASSIEMLAADKGDKWDSGIIQSNAQLNVRYGGAILTSGERCYWKVRVWDDDDLPSAWIEPAWFEMGLLEQSDWKSAWYGYPAGYTGQALYFRAFVELQKPVKRVRAYVAGLGLYEFYVNGHKANDHVLEPAQTNYGKRILYTTIDITPYMHQGRNGVGAIIGHGWYGTPRLRAQIHIEYEDGDKQTCSMTRNGIDNWGDWTVGPSPITCDSIFDGETYDARLERPGWCVPEDGESPFDPRQYWLAVPMDGPSGRMVAQTMEPIRVVSHVDPISVNEVRPGVFVFDMGQNMVGWVHLRVKGERGTAVQVRFSENLSDEGDIDQGNLRSAKCTDTYILKGEGVEEWEPRFTYHGFRYVQMAGFPGIPGLDAIRGCVVHSDVAQHGHFECGNELINRLQHAVLWTESGNLHGIPTDCPQRDERMGWLNDMTVRAEEANYNFDVNRLHSKWIADIHDEQDPQNGAIPDTAPYRFGSRPADPVTMC